VIVDDYQS
jgi:hypothetical protein